MFLCRVHTNKYFAQVNAGHTSAKQDLVKICHNSYMKNNFTLGMHISNVFVKCKIFKYFFSNSFCTVKKPLMLQNFSFSPSSPFFFFLKAMLKTVKEMRYKLFPLPAMVLMAAAWSCTFRCMLNSCACSPLSERVQ